MIGSETVNSWPATVEVPVSLDVDVSLQFLHFGIAFDPRYLTTDATAVVPDAAHFAPGGTEMVDCTVNEVDEDTAVISWTARYFGGGVAVIAAGAGPLVRITFTVEEAFARASTPLPLVQTHPSFPAVEAEDTAGQSVAIPTQTDGMVTDESLGLARVFAPGVDDGAYPAGAVLELRLDFSGAVTLSGGSLNLGLSSGGTVVVDPFGAAESVLGAYQVGAGENTEALDVVSLSLAPGATLQGQGGGDSDLRLPAEGNLSAWSGIVVDTDAPTATLRWASPTAVEVIYSEEVQGAHNPEHYVFAPGLEVSAAVHQGGLSYRLTTPVQVPARAHTVEIDPDQVADRAGNSVDGTPGVNVPAFFSIELDGRASVRLFFGLLEGANDELDDGLDEILGPGESRAYLLGPPTVTGVAGMQLMIDFRGDTEGVTRWRFVVDPVRERGDVIVNWDVSSDPTAKAMYLQRLEGEGPAGTPVDMKAVSSYAVVPGVEYEIAFGPLSPTSVDVGPGWNLIGFRVMTAAPAAVLFGSATRAPDRIGPLWVWRDGGFTRQDDRLPLAAERGGWAYCVDAGQTAVVEGIEADGLIELDTGWNLVSPAAPAPVPTGPTILGPAWWWDAATRTYNAAQVGDDLLPGRGYWIRASQTTVIRTGE